MAVVLVCSPSTVRTAKGSGKLNSSRLARPLALYSLTLIDRSGSFNLLELAIDTGGVDGVIVGEERSRVG